ncbi:MULTISPECIES: phosphotransferase [Paenibacillus]|uniref:phosphotransferase enzyme family protein n=1 Tax=Paenibacillus TaxID=44249 RepID=UPI00096CAFFB|nr:phosphotransferase [Paenibacillus odorifer]MEC0135178.1 phosphotransferase [Paenibacillus odorifer]MEC0225041.1 phosphotransferase [Paenibacillus odorifer]OME10167.1 aminoglycoside phosphotransferase [Paenibacillus odorifer]OME49232.1 aminoglycoside phosphotransferase [Paenibacillus odorifer]
MMKLSNMVRGLASDAVAKSLIQNWEHDEGTLTFWRASSNFVYAFENKQEKYFLRFSYDQESSIEQITAELEFMEYLKSNDYPCVSPILSVNGKYIETVLKSEGTYFAVVFSSAHGNTLDENITEVQCEDWGRSLASLHQLSKVYEPVSTKRFNWQDILWKIDVMLQAYPDEKEAIEELDILTERLQSFPISNTNYGIIHYDFQLDNIFYEENNRVFSVIDFDDAVYSWYALDIVTALDDFLGDDMNLVHSQVKSFLKGYSSVFPLNNEDINQFSYFQRLMKLYRFSKLLWSLEGSEVVDAPKWLDDVKLKFARVRDELRRGF